MITRNMIKNDLNYFIYYSHCENLLDYSDYKLGYNWTRTYGWNYDVFQIGWEFDENIKHHFINIVSGYRFNESLIYKTIPYEVSDKYENIFNKYLHDNYDYQSIKEYARKLIDEMIKEVNNND